VFEGLPQGLHVHVLVHQVFDGLDLVGVLRSDLEDQAGAEAL
jgi:hypothetical protein